VTGRLTAVAAASLLAAVVCVATPLPAHAHAVLTASSPGDGASVEQPPSEVLLTFNEAPDPALSMVQLLDSSGTPQGVGKVEAVPGQPTRLRVPLPRLSQGTYTVTWRTTSSADGHTTAGAVAFGVGVAAPAAGSEGVAAVVASPAPTVAAVMGRWLFYVGVVLMLGAAVVGVIVVSTPHAIPRRALAAAWAAAAAGAVVTVAEQRAAARTSLANLLSSSTGHKLAVQVLAVAVAGGAVAWAYRSPSRASVGAVGVGASAAMLARALAGHANASSPRWFTVGTQWVHLVSVGAWVGGLVWLLLAMRRRDPGQGPGLGRRFSSVAGWTLAVVAVSGTLRALDEVGAWSRLVDTSFGITLLAKVALFVALVALGARSRFRHVLTTSGGLNRAVRGEVAIAAGVLGATALLTGFPPAASVAAASKAGAVPPAVTVTGTDYGTSVRVRLVVSPGSPGPNSFDAAVEDYDSGEPVAADSVSLRVQLRERPEITATALELSRAPDGRWRGSGSALSMEGRWTVTAVVQTPADAVEVPMEVVVRPTTPSTASGSTDQPRCGQGASDPRYSVTFDSDPSPPKAERTTFQLTVRQDGKPVSGADVCVKVDMPDMQHPGVSTVAREVSPGRYDASLRFSMTGNWSGSVSIAEPGRPAVAVPLTFEVK
jgi:copper transport protein